MNGSPSPPLMVPKGIWSLPVSDGNGVTTMSKPSGTLPFISFSSQEPTGMIAASPSSHSVCEVVWSMPSEPLRM